MIFTFYLAAAIALAATGLTVTRKNAVHALMYLVVSLLAVAVIFFVLGAPFVAALEVVVYAGAIMVLFVFVVMMLNLGKKAEEQEAEWLKPSAWTGPGILCLALLGLVVHILLDPTGSTAGVGEVSPKEVALSLFGPYLLAVELASVLLLAGLIGAYHLGRAVTPASPREGA